MFYFQVIEVVFINCLKKKFSLKSKVKELRNKIYEVACHLALDGSKCKYLFGRYYIVIVNVNIVCTVRKYMYLFYHISYI